jgi:uncharacterized membrane protein HdeD (DUF308 family)
MQHALIDDPARYRLRGWQAVDGIITIILGALVLAQWPASGLWVIGLFIGIDLIFYGLAWIALALGLRTA